LFSETSAPPGTSATLADDQEVPLSFLGGWIKSPFEDLALSITLGDGTVAPGAVVYEGNGGQAFARSDLNFDGEVDEDDWPIYRDNHLTNLSGLTAVLKHNRGDLNGDGVNDFKDFRVFEADFDAANGPGAFASAFGDVPEPAAAILAMWLLVAVGAVSRTVRTK
jgi:hypothetical protein